MNKLNPNHGMGWNKPDEQDRGLEDLRDYLEGAYQGAVEADPHAYSGAARISFADYVLHRVAVHIGRAETAGKIKENERWLEWRMQTDETLDSEALQDRINQLKQSNSAPSPAQENK